MTLRPIYLFYILWFLNLQASAQLPTFDNPYVPDISERVKSINESKEHSFQQLAFSIDSIEIICDYNQEKIKSIAKFSTTKESLMIDCYLKNDSLIFIQIIQESARHLDLIKKYSDIYFHQNQEVLYWDYYQRPACLSHPADIESLDEFYGINEAFTEEFLRNLSMNIYTKIKQL